jgi:hypothetical protein
MQQWLWPIVVNRFEVLGEVEAGDPAGFGDDEEEDEEEVDETIDPEDLQGLITLFEVSLESIR